MLLGIESVSQTSASLTAGLASLAAWPARCLSSLVKEPGPGAIRTSNTARASASLTSAILARSAGSSGRSAPQSLQSVCPSRPSVPAKSGPFPPCARAAGPGRGRALRYAGLPSPWAQCMREARSGISRAASSPASPMRSYRLRFHSLGNSGSLRQASATLIPLRWNSQRNPSRSCLVYIPGSPRTKKVRSFVRGPEHGSLDSSLSWSHTYTITAVWRCLRQLPQLSALGVSLDCLSRWPRSPAAPCSAARARDGPPSRIIRSSAPTCRPPWRSMRPGSPP